MARLSVVFLFVLLQVFGLCFSAVPKLKIDKLIKLGELSRKTPEAVFRNLRKTFLKEVKIGRPQIDIVFVIDKSGSIGKGKFEFAKTFVSSLLGYYPVFPDKTRVAIVSYATTVKLEFDFLKYSDVECVRKGIDNIKFTGGLTATGDALNYVLRHLIFKAAAGARRNAKKIIFLLTDGRSNRGIAPVVPASQLKSRGVIIFALGITNSVNEDELRQVASGPQYVFLLNSFDALTQLTRLVNGGNTKRCRINGQTVYDECGRRCTCSNGRLTKCCRIRKEFTSMTTRERLRYINTVKIASKSSTYLTRYEKLLTIHKTFFSTGIHQVQYFLPWHRWFILEFENLLREIDCRVTVPYWDWSLVGSSPFTSDFWSPALYGFGGDGQPSCVKSGPFRHPIWSLISSAGGGCLRRDFSGMFPTALDVQILLLSNPLPAHFSNFEILLRNQFHDVVHCRIGGTMCTANSAAAPEFFLHHSFVDKLWWQWQRFSNDHKFHPYFTTQTQTMPATKYTSKDFLDLNNQPGCVCAEYEQPRSNIYELVQALPLQQLEQIPRVPLPPLSRKAEELFKTSQEDIERLTALRQTLEPNKALSIKTLTGPDRQIGFKESSLRLRPFEIRRLGDQGQLVKEE